MAVYTEITDDELEEFVSSYDIGKVSSCKGIAEGVENSNYHLQTTSNTYILTLYEKRVSPADLPFFLGLMDHLAAKGIACPTPIHDRDGVALRELAGRPAAIISFLNGLWIRRPGPDNCLWLGEAMAALHKAGQDFGRQRPNNLSLDGWRELLAATAPRADQVQVGLRSKLEEEVADLEAIWPKSLPSGVIHADLFPDNVFFLDDRLSGLIDFYFACNDFFAYDIAICLNAWCFEPDGSFNVTKARMLLAGYIKARALSADELSALPILARGAAVRFLLTRLYDLLNHVEGALVRPKDPLEYLQRLQFHRGVRSPAEYGLDELG
jgi:homoserine kinase type II